MSLPAFRQLEPHEKGWGREDWVCNTSDYCGKILRFHAGKRFSAHFHAVKAETFMLLSGTVSFCWNDPQTAAKEYRTLVAGDVVDIPRFCVHQIEALTDAVVIEFSTHHEDSDSYRVRPGDSQK